jgi:enoyl-CoA hydratase/carnithine racemase
MTDLVLVERREAVVEIILNRADKRNAMNWELLKDLDAAITQVSTMGGVRVLLLRGEGRGFSAGIDLMSFQDTPEIFGENWRHNMLPVTAAYQAIVNKFERCPYPVIALLHGYVLGLGLELALACDMRIVTEGTLMGLPETLLGIVPDVGGTTRLTRLIGVARAKEYIMTGKNIPIDCAERWGLVNYVVPKNGLMEKAEQLIGELGNAAPLAVSYAKQVINGLDDVDRGLQLEAWAQAHLMATEDFEVGAAAMMMKQKPQWKGK